jgi:[protein-PII] uridylyltransferase
MTATTLRALWRATDQIDPAFRRQPANRELFMQVLRSPTRVVRELKRMNQYGVLGRYIPAFGRIVGQMQHDLYHVYTVDEHILNVVRNLRRFTIAELAHEFPLCSRLMSDFERPELLYLAGLFHDIAKGRGGDHSSLGKADALRFCREHGLLPADAELVAWLVEHHLVMSATAQKQDMSDPEVINAFASKVGDDRHLVALYLLTVADIRGTSPKVWNAWKAKLLEDLFWITRRRLSGDTRSLQSSLQQRQEAVKVEAAAVCDRGPCAREALVAARRVVFPAARRRRNRVAHAPAQLPRRNIHPVGEGASFARGRRTAGDDLRARPADLFARICSFFERISYSIVEAKIYTTRHGYALDSFQIFDPDNRKPQYRDLIGYIEYELGQRLLAQTPLGPPGEGRLSRQLKHFPITPEVTIDADERGLYKCSPSLPATGRAAVARGALPGRIQDQSAHRQGQHLGDRAEDVFLINGEALNDPKTVVRFESELLRQLQI